jgi:hypothetical protein
LNQFSLLVIVVRLQVHPVVGPFLGPPEQHCGERLDDVKDLAKACRAIVMAAAVSVVYLRGDKARLAQRFDRVYPPQSTRTEDLNLTRVVAED